MKYIRKIIFKWLMSDFVVKERKMNKSDVRKALIDFYDNENLQKYVNIMIGNLIRKHLYVKNMEEKYNLSGQVLSLRRLQKLGEDAKQGAKEAKEEIET